MKLICLLLIFIIQQDQTPYKPREEFEIKLDFEFRDRPAANANTIELSQTQSRAAGPLPYLYLNLRVLKPSPEEVRVRVIENGVRTALNRKFDMNAVLKLDMGYTDDIKDRIKAYEYTVYYLTADKKPVSKVVIYFDEDGVYFVNNEKRGKI
jgi:hypothetical protein